MSRTTRVLTGAGTVLAGALTVHSALNAALLRRPSGHPPALGEAISVLLPVRDEAHRIEPCLTALLAVLDDCAGRAELVVLDDGSSDDTVEIIERLIRDAPRARLIHGGSLPPGWLGKPYACAQLADSADPSSTILAFVDADVELRPHALRAAVGLLRDHALDLVCPYPRQLAISPGERLVQPLLQWSWLTTLPLRLAERSARPSLSAGNGQFLVVDRATYARAGGHAAVRDAVLDDVALVRAVKRAAGRAAMADGTDLATCRMYDGWPQVRDGYTKSLWSAFGSRAGSAAVSGALLLAYVLPPVAAVARRSPVGLAGYALGVAGRVVTGRRTGARVWPDALAHPVSVLAVVGLTARSWRVRRRGGLVWKGRSLP